MIYAYDKTYLEDARRALARMLDYAVNDLKFDISEFYDRMVSIYMEEKPDTNLKSLRKRAKLSQKELSEITDIPIRTIQQYEQRQKDINKASMEYVYKLSKALMCEPKDLMEFVNKN